MSAIKAGRAAIEVFLDDAKMRRGLKSVQARLRAAGASMRTVGAGMLGAAAAGAVPMAAAVKTYADFADQMAVVRAVSGATEAQFKRLNDQAKELGRTTSYTATEVAGAQTELGRAGFNPDEIEQATPGILNLARATATELPEAANIAAAALRGFGMEAGEIGRVSDVLTVAANSSATTLGELGEAVKMVAPLAAEAGEPIESVTAALGILANNGIRGTMAGTAVARALKNLSTEAKQAELKKLGVDAVDQAGNLRPLAEILQELGEKTKGLGSAKRLAIFESLFGRGQAAALKLSGDSASFDDLYSKISAGDDAAAKTAATMDDTLGGSFRRIMSAAEGVQIAIGEALTPTLRGLEDTITGTLSAVTEWIGDNREIVVTVAKVVAGVAAAGAALVALGVGATALSWVFGGLASIVGVVGGVLGFLVSPVGIVIAGVAAIGSALYALYRYGDLDWLVDGFKAAAAAVGDWLSAFGESTGITDWLGSIGSALGELGSYLGGELLGLVGDLGDVFGETFGGMKDAFLAGDWQALGDIAMAGIEAAWSAGVARMVGIWENFKAAIVEAFAGAMIGIHKMWTDTQAKISTTLIEWSSRDDAVGAAARFVTGFDPREMEARNRSTQEGASAFKIDEWQRMMREAVEAGDQARADEIAGWIANEENRAASGAIYDQVDNFDAVAEAAKLIEAATEEKQAGVAEYWSTIAKTAREDADRRIEEYRKRYDDARADLSTTVDQAAADREAEAGSTWWDDLTAWGADVVDWTRDKLGEYAAGVDQARETSNELDGKLTSAGTFSGWNLGGQFNLENTAKEQLKEARKQTDELGEIARNTRRQTVFT